MRPCRPHQLVLLPLHHERVGHLALEQADVEYSNQLAGDAVAKMKERSGHSAARILGEGFVLEPELDQHFHGRRMNRGSALILGRLGLGFDERDRDAFSDQGERRHRSHRTGSDHDHPIILPHHPLQTIALYTPPCRPVTARAAPEFRSGCPGCGAARAHAQTSIEAAAGSAKRCAADPGPPQAEAIHASRVYLTCAHLSADLG